MRKSIYAIKFKGDIMEKEKEKSFLMKKKKVTLEEKLVLLENELNDYKKAYALKLAEFQNFSKRKRKRT